MSELGVDIHSAHITPFALNDITRHISWLNIFDACLLFLQQPHALKSIAAPNTHKGLHSTWWISSLFSNLQTSIRANNNKSSNSDYSCSVNFSDKNCNPWPQFATSIFKPWTCWQILYFNLLGCVSSLKILSVSRLPTCGTCSWNMLANWCWSAKDSRCILWGILQWPMGWKNIHISPLHVQSNNQSIHLKQIFNYNLHQMQLKVPILSCGCIWCISSEHGNLCNVHKNIIFFFVAFI